MLENDPLAAKPVHLESNELEKLIYPEVHWARSSSKPYDEKKYVKLIVKGVLRDRTIMILTLMFFYGNSLIKTSLMEIVDPPRL